MDPINRTLSYFLKFAGALLAIAALYLGRDILIPLALASLFTFLLNPLVKRLCRWGIPRVLSLATVTIVCFSSLALLGWLLGGELANLANELPNHRSNIQRRIESLQKIGETGIIQRMRQLVGDVSQPSTLPDAEALVGPPTPNPTATPTPPPPAAPPQNGESVLMKALNMVVSTLADSLGMAAVVILFVVFMLLRLNDISQRVVRLVGYSRLTLTTKAIDEAGDRISRYLLMQGTVNAIYGLVLGIGLTVIGLPYVLLWGVLATILRFIPYVGPWIVTVLLVGLSLAIFDGWQQPLLVIAFVATLELLTNMFLEPMLYGHSVGLSDFALLLAVAFWTWLWGGVGLLLATPLTVCIVVFCKQAPSLEWVGILMADNPPPQPHLNYYQDHLAGKEDSAQILLESSLRNDGLESTLEGLVLPALALTRHEEVLGKLDHDEAQHIYQSMRASLTLLKDEVESAAAELALAEGPSDPPQPALQIYGRALHGEPDAQALEMLALLLPKTLAMEVSAQPRLIGEVMLDIENKKPAMVCISAMPKRAQLDAKTLCRRLRSKRPDLKILVCRWGLPGQEHDPKSLSEAGATWVVSSLKEAREVLERRLE
ncbi:AI-2E family transporter [Prosthecobacter sp.]|uniref:AI-2E family transporter n=1 Tax=Prosthecobacter sp. TaxID=1965333 RepID=UPI00248A2868|nr:AI-2E family transporter [Prosthecobacter sp.]MDI1312847.1 AI-2E family transporter [Prosthecobacter sp.]